MTKTNAKRQAEYRQRHFKDIDGELERINLAVQVTTKRKLERLAVCYGVTQRALLENVLQAEENRALSGMTGEEQEAYYSLRRNKPKQADDLNALPNQVLNEQPIQDAPAAVQLLDRQKHEGEAESIPNAEESSICDEPTTKGGSPKSGYVGVSWHKQSGKWQAQVRENGKPKALKLYATPEEASAARLAYLAERDGPKGLELPSSTAATLQNKI
jgi:hypothetical protein